MQTYMRVLRQRVRDSRYAVDERAVAEAVIAHARPRVNADRANGVQPLARLEQQIKQFRLQSRAAPARSVRRATARAASVRRATAGRRQPDTPARVMEFLARQPQSTAGDLAKGLSLGLETVSTCLNQLMNAGDIEKDAAGYSTQRLTRPRRSRRSRPIAP